MENKLGSFVGEDLLEYLPPPKKCHDLVSPVREISVSKASTTHEDLAWDRLLLSGGCLWLSDRFCIKHHLLFVWNLQIYKSFSTVPAFPFWGSGSWVALGCLGAPNVLPNKPLWSSKDHVGCHAHVLTFDALTKTVSSNLAPNGLLTESRFAIALD